MSEPTKPQRIPTLWFDREGCGPDHMFLELHPFRSEMDGKIPAALGIRVRAGELVIIGRPLVDGGFNMQREQIAELHRQLGAWLDADAAQGGATKP